MQRYVITSHSLLWGVIVNPFMRYLRLAPKSSYEVFIPNNMFWDGVFGHPARVATPFENVGFAAGIVVYLQLMSPISIRQPNVWSEQNIDHTPNIMMKNLHISWDMFAQLSYNWYFMWWHKGNGS